MSGIEIRPAALSDKDFLKSLQPRLAHVPGPAWHTIEAMEGFQDRYMSSTFAPEAQDGARTLIAWSDDGRRLGYIHMRPGRDGVSDEPCGYVSLLALVEDAEGTGVARRLMAAAESWARGCATVSSASTSMPTTSVPWISTRAAASGRRPSVW